MFAFTPIAFMIMRGVVQGVAPSLEEAAQTLRASPHKTFIHRHAAAAQAGPGQCLPGGLHREHGRLRQPDRGGRAVFGAVHRHLLCHRGRPVRPGARGIAGLDPHLFALGVFALQRGLLGKQNYTTVSARAMPALPWRCPTVCAAC
jgi:iron(III) transport system permease protein